MPNFEQAFLIAITSACAVGSVFGTTRFVPVATTSPSLTITAPNGPPPLSIFSMERLIAICMNFSSSAVYSDVSFIYLSVVLIIFTWLV